VAEVVLAALLVIGAAARAEARVRILERVVLEDHLIERLAVGVRPHRERRDPPPVGPDRSAVEVESAGTVAEAERARLLGDEHRVDVGAGWRLEPRDDLELVARRELDVHTAPGRLGVREPGNDQTQRDHRAATEHRVIIACAVRAA
jgi:hypothetical protein